MWFLNVDRYSFKVCGVSFLPNINRIKLADPIKVWTGLSLPHRFEIRRDVELTSGGLDDVIDREPVSDLGQGHPGLLVDFEDSLKRRTYRFIWTLTWNKSLKLSRDNLVFFVTTIPCVKRAYDSIIKKVTFIKNKGFAWKGRTENFKLLRKEKNSRKDCYKIRDTNC